MHNHRPRSSSKGILISHAKLSSPRLPDNYPVSVEKADRVIHHLDDFSALGGNLIFALSENHCSSEISALKFQSVHHLLVIPEKHHQFNQNNKLILQFFGKGGSQLYPWSSTLSSPRSSLSLKVGYFEHRRDVLFLLNIVVIHPKWSKSVKSTQMIKVCVL